MFTKVLLLRLPLYSFFFFSSKYRSFVRCIYLTTVHQAAVISGVHRHQLILHVLACSICFTNLRCCFWGASFTHLQNSHLQNQVIGSAFGRLTKNQSIFFLFIFFFLWPFFVLRGYLQGTWCKDYFFLYIHIQFLGLWEFGGRVPFYT